MARLKCYFSDRGDPYYLLHPTKVEMAHMKPEILVFHDVISPKEMQTIKDLAAPIVRSVENLVMGTTKMLTLLFF